MNRGDLLILMDRVSISRDAIHSLEEIEKELASDAKWFKAWSGIALACRAVIIPLNVIINAFPLPNRGRLYNKFVLSLYKEFGASGSAIQWSAAKGILRELKDALVKELSTHASEYVPVVKIVVGMAEDSIALFEVALQGQEGSGEISSRQERLRYQIKKARLELLHIGSQLDDAIRKASVLGRTA